MKPNQAFHVSYLDASAAVKLVLREPGFGNLRKYLHLRGSRMTTLCFAEALGVLKRKWLHHQLSDEQYLGRCYLLVHGCRTVEMRHARLSSPLWQIPVPRPKAAQRDMAMMKDASTQREVRFHLIPRR